MRLATPGLQITTAGPLPAGIFCVDQLPTASRTGTEKHHRAFARCFRVYVAVWISDVVGMGTDRVETTVQQVQTHVRGRVQSGESHA